MPHPSYSPDLASSDYHLFRALKHHLREKKFNDLDGLKIDIAAFFDSPPRCFWSKGLETLPSRWMMVINNDGDYIVD